MQRLCDILKPKVSNVLFSWGFKHLIFFPLGETFGAKNWTEWEKHDFTFCTTALSHSTDMFQIIQIIIVKASITIVTWYSLTHPLYLFWVILYYSWVQTAYSSTHTSRYHQSRKFQYRLWDRTIPTSVIRWYHKIVCGWISWK